MNEVFLTVSEVSRRIGIPPSKTWAMCANGEVECIMVPCGKIVRLLIPEHVFFALRHRIASESTETVA